MEIFHISSHLSSITPYKSQAELTLGRFLSYWMENRYHSAQELNLVNLPDQLFHDALI